LITDDGLQVFYLGSERFNHMTVGTLTHKLVGLLENNRVVEVVLLEHLDHWLASLSHVQALIWLFLLKFLLYPTLKVLLNTLLDSKIDIRPFTIIELLIVVTAAAWGVDFVSNPDELFLFINMVCLIFLESNQSYIKVLFVITLLKPAV